LKHNRKVKALIQAWYPTSYVKRIFGSVEFFIWKISLLYLQSKSNLIIPFHRDNLLIEDLVVNHSYFHSTNALRNGQEL